MNNTLEKIKDFAAAAHKGQVRKFMPEAYIEHPIRVMKYCAQHSTDACIHYAALLHDVLEDTPVTKQKMKDFLHTVLPVNEAAKTLSIVIDLTDVYTKSSYPRLNRQERRRKEAQRLAATSPEAQTIKYADIIDNCKGFAASGSDFVPVFLKECDRLLDHLQKGNPALYRIAREVVSKEWKEVSAKG